MFGGAGGQHACSIAKTLAITRVIVPRYSSLLSAYGMALADVVRELSEPAAFNLTERRDDRAISERLAEITQKATNDLTKQGYTQDRIHIETFLNCRYHGTSTKLMISTPDDLDYRNKFYQEHKREFGFNLEGRNVLVDDLRIRATGKSTGTEPRSPYADFDQVEKLRIEHDTFPTKEVYFEDSSQGWMKSAIVPLSKLTPGHQIEGPSIVYDSTQTLLIEPGYIVSLDAKGNLICRLPSCQST
jgi:5-oxoprolinase (ATP-hydrolysing)